MLQLYTTWALNHLHHTTASYFSILHHSAPGWGTYMWPLVYFNAEHVSTTEPRHLGRLPMSQQLFIRRNLWRFLYRYEPISIHYSHMSSHSTPTLVRSIIATNRLKIRFQREINLRQAIVSIGWRPSVRWPHSLKPTGNQAQTPGCSKLNSIFPENCRGVRLVAKFSVCDSIDSILEARLCIYAQGSAYLK
jgi:hypothetical protein